MRDIAITVLYLLVAAPAALLVVDLYRIARAWLATKATWLEADARRVARKKRMGDLDI